MSDALLTIGQLAEYAGVTVRAVRHYHARGLLGEPERDASGYRRYGADAVLRLLRIKVLADAGVPLARIDEVLAAGPAELADAVRGIDAQLQERIAELERRRREIARLAAGERVLLPPELVDYLDALSETGVSTEALRLERDGWLLLLARYPEWAREGLAEKQANLADPDFRQIIADYDRASGWDPTDPRLEGLADATARYVERRYGTAPPSAADVDDPTLIALLGARVEASTSPALARLHELLGDRLPVEPAAAAARRRAR